MKVNILTVEATGDAVVVTGTVDGQAAQAHAWQSHLDTLKDDAARRLYLAGLLVRSVTVVAHGLPSLAGELVV